MAVRNFMEVAHRNRKVGPAGGSIYLSKDTLDEDVVIPAGYNAMVPGDLTVPANVNLDATNGSLVNVE